jgi:hypothetical protein
MPALTRESTSVRPEPLPGVRDGVCGRKLVTSPFPPSESDGSSINRVSDVYRAGNVSARSWLWRRTTERTENTEKKKTDKWQMTNDKSPMTNDKSFRGLPRFNRLPSSPGATDRLVRQCEWDSASPLKFAREVKLPMAPGGISVFRSRVIQPARLQIQVISISPAQSVLLSRAASPVCDGTEVVRFPFELLHPPARGMGCKTEAFVPL